MMHTKRWITTIGQKIKAFIVFDDMITNMISNNFCQIVIELFIRDDSKLNVPFTFVLQSYMKIPTDVRLSTMHFFICY